MYEATCTRSLADRLAAAPNMWHTGMRQQSVRSMKYEGNAGKTCHTWFDAGKCKAITRDTISH